MGSGDDTQRFTTPLPTYEPLFATEDAEKALEHVIAIHLLRTGRFSTAETFIQVCHCVVCHYRHHVKPENKGVWG